MFLNGGRTGMARRKELRGTVAAHANKDPATALVMSHLGQLVSDGFATWKQLDNGEVAQRFHSGEVFLLADTALTRIA